MTNIDTIIANNTATDPNTVPTATDANDELGQDAFLKLLVAQLRYQDPMSPQDSSEFLSQTAQFTQVEKLEEIADAMAMLSTNDQLSTIGNLVGKVVQHQNALGNIVDTTITSGRIHDNGITLIGADGSQIGLADVIGVTAPTPPSDEGEA
ncbi:MAG: flagellar hook capping FlgD N-terminal domain-containing protein [Actinomycetota bacterium]